MESILFEADSRGLADHDWLRSRHTFSFADYYNPKRMGFGVLRVINDDVVQPGKGFGTHPHQNMEIISIPLRGTLRHQDSMANRHMIKKGEVQIMSAGTGVTHSEYNNSDSVDVNFLQIWVLPKKKNIEPRYGQTEFKKDDRMNRLQVIVSPDGRDGSLEINQDAFFSQVNLSKNKELRYKWFLPDNYLFLFLLEGQLKVGNQLLKKRDGLGIVETQEIPLMAESDTEILLMEIPK